MDNIDEILNGIIVQEKLIYPLNNYSYKIDKEHYVLTMNGWAIIKFIDISNDLLEFNMMKYKSLKNPINEYHKDDKYVLYNQEGHCFLKDNNELIIEIQNTLNKNI